MPKQNMVVLLGLAGLGLTISVAIAVVAYLYLGKQKPAEQIPTTKPPSYIPGTIPSAATWAPFYSNLDSGKIDIGKAKADELFGKTWTFKRECPDCTDDYKVVVYKRLKAPPAEFSMYNNAKGTWSSSNNLINQDFAMYSSVDDARNGTNAWTFCNYDDPGVGGFRDCGKSAPTTSQWNSETHTGGKKATYSVLTAT